MTTVLAFLAAAGAGAVLRAEAGRRLSTPCRLPLGTVAVNVTGSFLLGLLAGLTGPAVTVAAVGGLGTATTFSSFAHDVVALVERRRRVASAIYLVASCAGSLGAAAVGIAIAG